LATATRCAKHHFRQSATNRFNRQQTNPAYRRPEHLSGPLRTYIPHEKVPSKTGTIFRAKVLCLGWFIDHLIEAGVATATQTSAKKLTALDRLRNEYEAYLRQQRGLADFTIAHCMRFLERFIVFRLVKSWAT